jgi:hypothetical protein
MVSLQMGLNFFPNVRHGFILKIGRRTKLFLPSGTREEDGHTDWGDWDGFFSEVPLKKSVLIRPIRLIRVTILLAVIQD